MPHAKANTTTPAKINTITIASFMPVNVYTYFGNGKL